MLNRRPLHSSSGEEHGLVEGDPPAAATFRYLAGHSLTVYQSASEPASASAGSLCLFGPRFLDAVFLRAYEGHARHQATYQRRRVRNDDRGCKARQLLLQDLQVRGAGVSWDPILGGMVWLYGGKRGLQAGGS